MNYSEKQKKNNRPPTLPDLSKQKKGAYFRITGGYYDTIEHHHHPQLAPDFRIEIIGGVRLSAVFDLLHRNVSSHSSFFGS
jgi:hypothetical protein